MRVTGLRAHTSHVDAAGGHGRAGGRRGQPGTSSTPDPQTSIMHILLEHSPVWKPPKSLHPPQDQLKAQIPPAKPQPDHLITFGSILCKSHGARVQYLTEAWMRLLRAGRSAAAPGALCPPRANPETETSRCLLPDAPQRSRGAPREPPFCRGHSGR